MAKIVKKKKRIIDFRGFAIILLTFSLCAWLISSLLINTINTSLTMKIQLMQEEVEALQIANQALIYEINTLENKDRIYALAQEANLLQDSNNIIALAGD